jgi:hypothetical protein
MAEGEALWGTISGMAQRFRDDAPPGAVAAIDIERMDGENFSPTVIQRYPPWIIFEAVSITDPLARTVTFVREDDIRSVRMRYERGERQIGFSVGEIAAIETDDDA